MNDRGRCEYYFFTHSPPAKPPFSHPSVRLPACAAALNERSQGHKVGLQTPSRSKEVSYFCGPRNEVKINSRAGRTSELEISLKALSKAQPRQQKKGHRHISI